MIFGNSIISQCPICGRSKELLRMLCGNTYGAENWSDTKMNAPMMPERSPVQKCPHCGHYYLLSKVKTEKGDNSSTEGGWLSFKEMLEAVEESDSWDLTSDEYFEVLLTALWSFNDLERYGKMATRDIYVKVKPIIIKLIPMVKDSLFKAELYRELEMYKESLDILYSYDAPNENAKCIAKQLITCAENKNRIVVKVLQDEKK